MAALLQLTFYPKPNPNPNRNPNPNPNPNPDPYPDLTLALQEAIAAGDARTARLIFDLTGQGGKGEQGGQGEQGGKGGKGCDQGGEGGEGKEGGEGGEGGKGGALSAEDLQDLGKVPDFRLRIRWHFGGLGPIGWAVKKYAPADNYEVYKRGARLRIDGTLLGYNVQGKGYACNTRHI